MKYLAKLDKRPSSKIVTIWQVKRNVEKYPQHWGGREYYSLFGDRPMKACFPRSKKWSFAYKAAHTPIGHGNGGEGVTHDLAKLVLLEQKFIKIIHYGKIREITFIDAAPEFHFTSGQNDHYYIDLVATFDQPNDLANEFNRKIGIEIKVTHAVEKIKIAALKKLDFGSIEIEIPEKFHFHNCETATEEAISHLKSSLKNFFSSPVKCLPIHNPNYKKYTVPKNKNNDTPLRAAPALEHKPQPEPREAPCQVEPITPLYASDQAPMRNTTHNTNQRPKLNITNIKIPWHKRILNKLFNLFR